MFHGDIADLLFIPLPYMGPIPPAPLILRFSIDTLSMSYKQTVTDRMSAATELTTGNTTW